MYQYQLIGRYYVFATIVLTCTMVTLLQTHVYCPAQVWITLTTVLGCNIISLCVIARYCETVRSSQNIPFPSYSRAVIWLTHIVSLSLLLQEWNLFPGHMAICHDPPPD